MRKSKITTSPSRVNPLFCSFYIPDHKKKKKTLQKYTFEFKDVLSFRSPIRFLVGFYFVNKSPNPGVPMDTHAFRMRILSSARCAYIIPAVTTLEPSSARHSLATVRGNRNKSRRVLSFSFFTSHSFCTTTVCVRSCASDAPLLRRPVSVKDSLLPNRSTLAQPVRYIFSCLSLLVTNVVFSAVRLFSTLH